MAEVTRDLVETYVAEICSGHARVRLAFCYRCDWLTVATGRFMEQCSVCNTDYVNLAPEVWVVAEAGQEKRLAARPKKR